MNTKEIVAMLKNADNSYYNKSDSIMPDQKYDELKDKLRKLDPDNPYLKAIGSPVPVSSKWKKARHGIPMTSLNKVINESEFVEWAHEIGGSDGNLSGIFVIQEKLDGSSIDLEYKNGNLVHCLRRGDGSEGQDILENVCLMKNVRTRIEDFTGSIRGEVFILAPDFEKLIKFEDFENPRNAASGICLRHDHKYSEFCTILYYDVVSEDFEWETEDEKIRFLQDHNLQTVVNHSVSMKDVIRIFNEYITSRRANLDHDIDGMVVKLNNIDKQKNWGERNNNPKAQIAWKFPPIIKNTKIIGVRWDQGRNGRLTPVAILEPTRMGGITITHALLHNLEIFKDFNLGSGDTISLTRSNDVIPFIKGVVSRTTSKRFPIIDKCPTCGEHTTINGKFLMCLSQNCPGNVVGHILKWIDKVGIKTLGVGKKTIEKLVDVGLVKTPADLYRLTIEQVMKLDGQGHRSAEKIVEIIQGKKEINLATFIGGLNIRGNFSSEMAQLLIDSGYDTIEKLMRLAERKDYGLTTAIKGIGNSMAEAFWVGMEEKKDVIQDLLTVVTIVGKENKKEQIKMANNKLNGAVFCFTGKVERIDENGERWTRSRLWELTQENGGKISESVTVNTNYLVQADVDSTSSKSQKAKKLGVTLLAERDFFKMIGM